MRHGKTTALLGMILGGALALTGCFDSDNADSGVLSLSITDAPVDDATAVVVEFTAVSIKPADGEAEVFEFDEPRSIDLLTLQGNASEALLEDELVDAGDYEWVRLHVNAENGLMDSFIEFEGGGQHSLFVPSGSESGLKLVSGFTVPVNGSADFTIDFDLRKSVHSPETGQIDYILRPALRLVNNVEVGSIAGTVDSTWASDSECAAAVYVYEGHDATLGSTGSSSPPVTTALVELDNATGEFEYTAGFLLEGDYTAAFTCEADLDEPDQDNALTFLQDHNTSVTADAETEVNFVSGS